MDLTSKIVLMTGSRRMGPAIAERLARRGADIAVAYRRSRDEADHVVDVAERHGRRGLVVQADVSDSRSATAMIEAVEAGFGRLDVLINMASTYESVAIDALTSTTWHRHLSVDLHGTFNACLAAVPLMRRGGGGRMINFTDWVAASSRPRYRGYVPYYVAKAGVKALTEALALELAPDRILVNAIAPGPILAPPGTSDEEQDAVARATPLGQWGGPDEIAKIIEALVDSDFVTGETIRIDGGRHVR